jgi:hypothetical protein
MHVKLLMVKRFLDFFYYKTMINRVNEIIYKGLTLIGDTARGWRHGEDIEAALDPLTGKVVLYEFIDETQVYNEYSLV